MANAMDNLRTRLEQNKKFQEVQEALKNNNVTPANDNRIAHVAVSNDRTVEQALNQASPEAKAKADQVIAAAKENIPGDTMKDVNTNEAPLHSPTNQRSNPVGLDTKHVDAQTEANIESYQKGQEKPHRAENAMDRLKARQSLEPKHTQENNAITQEHVKTR
jgi:hypothetical protein